jgi:hypothetical protein
VIRANINHLKKGFKMVKIKDKFIKKLAKELNKARDSQSVAECNKLIELRLKNKKEG